MTHILDSNVRKSCCCRRQWTTTLARTIRCGSLTPLSMNWTFQRRGPNSIHYAGKKFDQLPLAYKQAFKKYRLAVIKLRNLEDGMRLEIFRRINQGGTPLSGQDIRLAYYGAKSPSLAVIRLAGVYDPDREASGRFLKTARTQFGLAYPCL